MDQPHRSAAGTGTFTLVAGAISIAILGAAAALSGQPFVFPSLGPTAFLLFTTPLAPAAAPRTTLVGHAVGLVAGYLSLVVFGLTDAPSALATSVSWPRVGAAALSVGLTGGVLVWVRCPHPPAGATTLLVSLGVLVGPAQLVVVLVAVVLLVVEAWVLDHAVGIPYPRWAPAGPGPDAGGP